MALKITDECIACGTCLEACEFEAIVEGDEQYSSNDNCTECGACEAACPQGIPLMLLNVALARDAEDAFGVKTGYDPEAEPRQALRHRGQQTARPEDQYLRRRHHTPSCSCVRLSSLSYSRRASSSAVP